MAQLTSSMNRDGFNIDFNDHPAGQAPAPAQRGIRRELPLHVPLFREQGEDFPLTRLHAHGFCFSATFVVVAEQVQYPVQEQEIEFPLEGDSRFSRIALGSVGGNNDIAEQPWLDACAFPFLHGEGDDIGGLVAAQIVAVNDPDF